MRRRRSNPFANKFTSYLHRQGWRLSERGSAELPMWIHRSYPGRRFDTACAVVEALKSAPKVVITGG
jgi:hypothetical protein